MAYFLFIDESGQDRHESPYEVLAGIAIQDRDLWNFIKAVQDAEVRFFGKRYSSGSDELKARKLLKRKVFRLAAQLEPIAAPERTQMALNCLDYGPTATRGQITALAQAKLAYVKEIFEICSRFRCKAFASIVESGAPRPDSKEHLRKDYIYLFERFFYFLEDADPDHSGIVVFDELEKSQSHVLVSQMDSYFKKTAKGQQRSGLIVPEPFFVHSDLTTGIQIADLVAYVISWGLRFPAMSEDRREELEEFAQRVKGLQAFSRRDIDGNPDFLVRGYALINDLRPRDLIKE